MSKNIRVLVYGTLKQGFGPNDLLRKATYIGRATLDPSRGTLLEDSRDINVDDVTADAGNMTDARWVLSDPGHDAFPAITTFTSLSLLEEENLSLPVPTGEVYEIPDDPEVIRELMTSLDNYEGYPSLYRRAVGMATVRCEVTSMPLEKPMPVVFYYMPDTGMPDEHKNLYAWWSRGSDPITINSMRNNP